MEINMTQLCDLDLMLDDAKILARVISIWMSHPKQRPNEVWSLDAVLQDQMGNRVQATVRNQDIKKFQPILDEGACYRISNFGIGENGGNIPLLDHRYKLSFFKNTALTRVGIFDSNPRGFRFEHFGAFTSRKIFERELCEDEIFPSVKYKIKTLDLDNFTYSMAVMDGEEDESTLSEMKVDTVSRWMLQIYTKYKGINDDQVESKKEQVAQ
ncbi:replication protein A 70 kDa DNA-binding subunit B [Tanacetum coccineum]